VRRPICGIHRATANSACRQQGLLHIYQQTCSWRRCGACLVGPGGLAGQ
jgi:hypothetical protein